MNIIPTTKDEQPVDPVCHDSLCGIPRRQTNAGRWDGAGWEEFVKELKDKGIAVIENRTHKNLYLTDAGGIAAGLPHGIYTARSAKDVSEILKSAQTHKAPVTTRGGGLTTEGESVAYGGLLLDMRGMSEVINIDPDRMTVRCGAGIYWHSLAEALRRQGLDYLSAPLNLTSSVGGTLCVGGIDVNSPRLGCSADQAVGLQVVTPTGEIVECSDTENPELFNRVLLGYGQFGVITEATLKIRKFHSIALHYFYYDSLKRAINDMFYLVESDATDYCGILTMLDRAINLLVAFDTPEREAEFMKQYKPHLKGRGETGFAIRAGMHYALRPWKYKEALYLLDRKKKMLPDFTPPHHMKDGRIVDRTVVFSRAVWKYWGGSKMVIPDIASNKSKFIEAVERGNDVCKRYFKHYTLYCVGIKLAGPKARYEMSCIPPDADNFAYGCEFEPMLEEGVYSRDHIQSFKNDIYDIGVDLGTSYYRFGGMMKGYIRRVFGDELVDKHLRLKREADPAMVLNPDVVF